METYIAFLRGINVGGNNIIKMADLKAEFEKLKFQNVSTFIASGNVLFQSTQTDSLKIERIIEKALSKKFNYTARVIVRTDKQMRAVIKSFPKLFSNATWKHNVIFLGDEIDNKDILKLFPVKTEIEQLTYVKGTLFWSANLDQITKSTMLKLATKKEYKEMTVRNTNTAKKVAELLSILTKQKKIT